MKPPTWTLVLCLFGMLALLALPPVDAPETAFNEVDTPINVAHPTLPRLVLAAPILQSLILPHSIPFLPTNERTANSIEVLHSFRSPDLQPLLCTFLI